MAICNYLKGWGVKLITKAMVMAAGVGSRLEPLTQDVPKPLVPVLNKPVMDILLQKLKDFGVQKVIANTHYLADKIEERYTTDSPVDIEVQCLFEEVLSGTAGGVKKCKFFFEDVEDFLVVSADGLHDADFDRIVKSHKESGCIATMAIVAVDHEEVSKYGVVVPSDTHTVFEFQEKPQIEEAKSDFINTGIYVFNKKIFDYIPDGKSYDFAKNVFPDLLQAGEEINTYQIYAYWSDIGTLDQYIQSNKDALAKKVIISNSNVMKKYEADYTVGHNCEIDKNVKFLNNVIVGNNCKIGKNVVLDDVILWDNIVIEDNVTLKNVVIANDTTVKSSVKNEIIGSNKTIDYTLAK